MTAPYLRPAGGTPIPGRVTARRDPHGMPWCGGNPPTENQGAATDMTTYKLPDGTECGPAAIPGLAKPDFYVWVEHPKLGSISIDSALVDEVKPPLPPEPPRDGTPWYDPSSNEIWRGLGDGWYGYGNDISHRWSELCNCDYADPSKWQRLIPDPADDAPELPFKIWQSGERSAIVEPSDAYADRLFVEVDSAHLVRKDVRQLAAALWAWAAREAEQP